MPLVLYAEQWARLCKLLDELANNHSYAPWERETAEECARQIRETGSSESEYSALNVIAVNTEVATPSTPETRVVTHAEFAAWVRSAEAECERQWGMARSEDKLSYWGATAALHELHAAFLTDPNRDGAATPPAEQPPTTTPGATGAGTADESATGAASTPAAAPSPSGLCEQEHPMYPAIECNLVDGHPYGDPDKHARHDVRGDFVWYSSRVENYLTGSGE